jgi:hypothetical protein
MGSREGASGRGTNVKSAGGGAGQPQFTGHEKLMPQQIEAIREYQEAMNERINNHFRGVAGYEGALADYQIDVVHKLDIMTSQGRINQPTVLHRGWSFEQGTSILPAHLYVGMTMTDPGFLSTSTKRKVAESFAGSFNGVIMTVRVPAGTRGLYVQGAGASKAYTEGKKAEHEVLLPRGTKYKVRAAKRRADGVLVLDAELVP